MASASSSSARFLFSDSKRRLADRVSVNVNNGASVARQIVRGSKSSEVICPIAHSFDNLTLPNIFSPADDDAGCQTIFKSRICYRSNHGISQEDRIDTTAHGLPARRN